VSEFLDQYGWKIFQPIPSDASLRRYTRVIRHGKTALFMDCSALEKPGQEVRGYIRIAGWLNQTGLKAPAIYKVYLSMQPCTRDKIRKNYIKSRSMC
jgi:aminoglycoside/choline kinase family phosphotransferase